MYDLLETAEPASGRPHRLEVERRIPGIHFACNLEACKGSCCTLEGGRGAPVLDEEVHSIRACQSAALKFLSPRNSRILTTMGPVSGESGSFCTTCVEDRDCVFVSYDGEIARCSLEQAYLEGLTSWRKPLSCHLFPIRVDRDGNWHRLRFESLESCRPALERGESEGTTLGAFVRDALIRAYGEKVHAQIERHCRSRRSASQDIVAGETP